jgi:hypothetical protein
MNRTQFCGPNPESSMMRSRIHTLMLCIGLTAGWAVAAPPTKDAAPPPSFPLNITRLPETCPEQCELMSRLCTQPCGDSKVKRAKAFCESNCRELVSACSGSCQDKGYIDGQYMKDHIKMPQLPPSAQEN